MTNALILWTAKSRLRLSLRQAFLAIAPADKPRKPSAAVSLAEFIGKR